MRIYNDNDNTIINELEIILTQEEAQYFYFRINDAAHNPGYKYDTIIDDVVLGDEVVNSYGTRSSDKSLFLQFMKIQIFINFQNLFII